jgi:uncharacterized protein DUF2510
VQQPQAGLEIKAGFFPLAFILFFCTPHFSIDGSPPIRGKWGDNLFPVAPGRHEVTAWYPYGFIKRASKATLIVDVAQGQVAQLTYRPNILYIVFLAGRLKQVGVRPIQVQAAAAQPAGWHPDPAGRHQMRYWNGSGWTDDVSDAGVAAKDPTG